MAAHSYALPALLAGAVFLAFRPALEAGFVNWDDPSNLTQNPRFQGLDGEHLRWMFTTCHLGPYQPLAWLSLGLDHELWGLSGPLEFPEAPLYHRTSVALHALGAVLVYAFALVLLKRVVPAARARPRAWTALAAALAAGAWAIHPLRAESVAWVTERRDVLAALFFALALWAYVRWAPPGVPAHPRWSRSALSAGLSLAAAAGFFASVDFSGRDALALRPFGAAGLALSLTALAGAAWVAAGILGATSRPRSALYFAALAAFLASLLAKGIGLALPLALLVLDVLVLGRLASSRSRSFAALAAEKAPLFALSLVFGALALWGQSSQPEALISWRQHTLPERVAQVSYGLAFYPWKTLWPAGLSPMVELPPSLGFAQARFATAALAVLAAAAAALALRRRFPALLASLLAFALLAAPVLGLTQAGPQLVADRYSLLACLPFPLLLAGAALHAASTRPRAALPLAAIGLAAAFALGARTHAQAAIWKDSRSLWTHAREVDPSSPAAHQLLALAHMEEARNVSEASRRLELLREAVALLERGYELGRSPRFLEYLADAEEALASADPSARAAHLERSIRCSREALEAAGGGAFELRLRLASRLEQAGLAAEAEREFARCARDRPQEPSSRAGLARALLAQGRAAEARDAFAAAARLAPSAAEVWLGLAQACRALGDAGGEAEAREQAERLRGR